ncbi:hypothetical protein Zmor_015980 [Zophobas morio]|uniref:Uncharacterized protein n=1 Tax=Zophobas morio TaxID=2755281 RepID=A0AA38IJ18_9CUCU|nr:hypothetical protein Zmor_015979 [Zophobas morio]KAJ3656936.1 hypothetical protein Zmor_015980 [Zophobas morio]
MRRYEIREAPAPILGPLDDRRHRHHRLLLLHHLYHSAYHNLAILWIHSHNCAHISEHSAAIRSVSHFSANATHTTDGPVRIRRLGINKLASVLAADLGRTQPARLLRVPTTATATAISAGRGRAGGGGPPRDYSTLIHLALKLTKILTTQISEAANIDSPRLRAPSACVSAFAFLRATVGGRRGAAVTRAEA